MESRDKEREGEAIVIGREHPFVVNREDGGEQEPEHWLQRLLCWPERARKRGLTMRQ
jgi:hypothetical protein